jgi:hypothetical protein
MRIKTIVATVTAIAAALSFSVGFARQLPSFPTGDLVVHSLDFGIYDVRDPAAVTLKGFFPHPSVQGEGIAFDAEGNLYIGVADGLDVYDAAMNGIGHASAVAPDSTRTLFLAIRPGQAFGCNPVRTPYARLFVFDITNPSAPAHTNTVNIPDTEIFGGSECRGIAFDAAGSLWVTAFSHLIRLALDPAGNPTWLGSFYPGGNPFALAFQPVTEHLFYSAVNENYVGIVNPAVNAAVRIATLTNVCDNATNNPLTIAFSSSGDMFVGCATHDGATTDMVAFRAATLIGLIGDTDASTLNPIRILRPELNHAVHLAFRPVLDSDGDGIDDASDNCASVANPGQGNVDGDSLGDACDPDDDNDGFADGIDNCPSVSNPDQADFDNDGIGDVCDSQTGPPTDKDQCREGWDRFDTPAAFKNQGDCIQFVNTGKGSSE